MLVDQSSDSIVCTCF